MDLAAGGDVTYHVSAKVAGNADVADLGFEAAPGPANGELNPADNVGTTAVVLTPKAATPSLTHTSNGVVDHDRPDLARRLADHVASAGSAVMRTARTAPTSPARPT